jgi:hypothetical protein
VTWLRGATAAMARLHAIPLSQVPAEIPTWPRLLDRWTPDGLPPALGSAAAEVITELRHRARVARRAFCHGDFYLGNLLFAGEMLTGIVDWERAKVMPAGNEVARFRMDLAIHPGGDAPGVFLNAYLKQTAAPAVEDLALWDVLAGAVGLASADRSRQGLQEIGVSLDTVTVARRATGFLENALAGCLHHGGDRGRGRPQRGQPPTRQQPTVGTLTTALSRSSQASRSTDTFVSRPTDTSVSLGRTLGWLGLLWLADPVLSSFRPGEVLLVEILQRTPPVKWSRPRWVAT